MKIPKRIPRKKIQRTVTRWGAGCSDRMCGAEDCSTCYPFHSEPSENQIAPEEEYYEEYATDS